jgi:hypothetical protein
VKGGRRNEIGVQGTRFMVQGLGKKSEGVRPTKKDERKQGGLQIDLTSLNLKPCTLRLKPYTLHLTPFTFCL